MYRSFRNHFYSFLLILLACTACSQKLNAQFVLYTDTIFQACDSIPFVMGLNEEPGYQYSWSPQLHLQSPDSSKTSALLENNTSNNTVYLVYTQTISDSQGTVVHIRTYEIYVSKITEIQIQLGNYPLCKGDTFILSRPPGLTGNLEIRPTATSFGGVNDDLIYFWPSDTTQYEIISIDSLYCGRVTFFMEIDVKDFTPATLSASQTFFCEGGADDTTQIVAIPPGGSFGGLGVNQAGIFNASIAGSGEHSIIYFSFENGCVSSDTLIIEVATENSVTIDGLTNLCATDTILELSYGHPSGGTYLIDGEPKTGSFNPSVLGSGSHTLTYSYIWEGNCTFTKEQVFFIIPIPPKPILEAPDGLLACEGDSLTLRTTLFPTYFWSTGQVSPEIEVKTSGHYSVFFRSNIGCYSYSDTLNVVISPAFTMDLTSPLFDNGFAISQYGATDGSIEIQVQGGLSPFQIDVSPNVGTVDQWTISDLNAGFYTITLSDQVGCTSFDTLSLFQPDFVPEPIDSSLRIPNAFTPNGDGHNDFFVIQGLIPKYAKNTFRVWNISRQLVYSTSDYTNTWDGKDNQGVKLPAGTYFAVFTSESLTGVAKTYIDIRYE